MIIFTYDESAKEKFNWQKFKFKIIHLLDKKNFNFPVNLKQNKTNYRTINGIYIAQCFDTMFHLVSIFRAHKVEFYTRKKSYSFKVYTYEIPKGFYIKIKI